MATTTLTALPWSVWGAMCWWRHLWNFWAVVVSTSWLHTFMFIWGHHPPEKHVNCSLNVYVKMLVHALPSDSRVSKLSGREKFVLATLPDPCLQGRIDTILLPDVDRDF